VPVDVLFVLKDRTRCVVVTLSGCRTADAEWRTVLWRWARSPLPSPGTDERFPVIYTGRLICLLFLTLSPFIVSFFLYKNTHRTLQNDIAQRIFITSALVRLWLNSFMKQFIVLNIYVISFLFLFTEWHWKPSHFPVWVKRLLFCSCPVRLPNADTFFIFFALRNSAVH